MAAADSTQNTATQAMPDELSARHLGKRLLQLAALVVIVVAVIWATPGLGSLRNHIKHASGGWLALGVALELLSMISYVIVFRAVFCPRMSWRLSFQIGLAEQAANSLLPAGGAGGLALGAWALRQGGASADHIARRTVAFFLVTSLANVGVLILFAVGYAVGILGNDPRPGVTYGFAAAGVVAILFTLSLPWLLRRYTWQPPASAMWGRVHRLIWHGLAALGEGVSDMLMLLRRRPVGVLVGSLGYLLFDIAVLGVSFLAFGHSPSISVLVVAYIIGQLGGLLPIPGGIGGTEGGLIGLFVLYHSPLALATAAVLVYRVIQLWLPALIGSLAFVRLRKTLHHQAEPAVLCQPLALEVADVNARVASPVSGH